jgi:hypothetical protein
LPVELERAPQEPQFSPVAVSPPPPSDLAPTSIIVSPLVADVRQIAAIFDTKLSRLSHVVGIETVLPSSRSIALRA